MNMQLLQRVVEVEHQLRLMQDQLNKFITAQEEENIFMREQIAQLFSLHAFAAGLNSPSRPTTGPPCTKIDSLMAEVDTHTTSSTGGDMERDERTA